jgi:hypothetical protein
MQNQKPHAEFRDPDTAHASGQAAACGEGGEGSFGEVLRELQALRKQVAALETAVRYPLAGWRGGPR